MELATKKHKVQKKHSCVFLCLFVANFHVKSIVDGPTTPRVELLNNAEKTHDFRIAAGFHH